MHPRRTRTVVAGVDGSDAALRAVRWAAREASLRRIPLRLIHAYAWPDTGPTDPELWDRYREVALLAARDRLAAAAAAATQAAPEIEVEQQLIVGAPVTVLQAEATRAQLVVLGDRGLGGFARLRLGSVAITLAAHAVCPVVVVRGDIPVPSDAPVVVGIDGSPTSEAAIEFAYEAAAARRVALVAVHTWWGSLVEPALTPLLDWDAIEADERRALAERLAGWGEKYPDVPVERLVARDRPARALLARAADAQLVVVGSRGHGGFAGPLLGSVSHALLHHAECPVAVVRPAVGNGT